MNKRISLGAALSLLLIVAALVFSATMSYALRSYNDKIRDLKEREALYAKYAEIDSKVRQNYNGVIDETALMDSVARGYIEGIGDRYGSYIDAGSYERLMRSQDSEIAGIGAVLRVNPETGYLLVEEVYPDSPAQAAGIEAGDLIVRMDGTDLTKENGALMLEAVLGNAGTKLALTVRRGAEERTIDDLVRRQVAVPRVFSRMLKDTAVGYVRIKEFGASASDQFNRELQKLRDAGAKSLIFDVRDTAGGRLRQTTRILDRLLPAGPLVSATYKDGEVRVLETSDANSINLPVVVLQNAGTSGYAELFAQVLMDYGAGKTVGTLTAGMGALQEMIKLSDGSAIEITVAYLNTPSGGTYDEIGVKPDFEVTAEGDWQGMDENTDPQLIKAIEVAVGAQKTVASTEEQSPSEALSGTASQP